MRHAKREMVEARRAQGIGGISRGPAVRRTAAGRGTAADRGDAGLDRSRAQGRQGLVLLRRWSSTPPSGWARCSRPNIRASPCGSSAPAPSGFSSASRRSRAAASRRSTSPTPPIPRIISTGKRTAGWRPIFPKTSRKHFPADQVDPDGMHATSCAWMEAIGYNTDLVKREDAPKSYADLLDPKWQGKIVKGHPGYSGAIMTATFVLTRDLGWPYLEKLAQQKVMQVQSAADPPKKILLGERAVMADGNDYNLVLAQGPGQAGRGGLRHRRLAADHRALRHLQAARPIRTRQGCSRASSSAPRPSNCWSTPLRIARSMPRSRRSPATCRCRRSNC